MSEKLSAGGLDSMELRGHIISKHENFVQRKLQIKYFSRGISRKMKGTKKTMV
jgi:hypothetical protein